MPGPAGSLATGCARRGPTRCYSAAIWMTRSLILFVAPQLCALAESVSTGLAFELGLEGTWRESSDSNASTGAEHGIGVGAGWRLVGPSRGGPAFEMRIDAARFAAANDDQSSDDRIGFSVTARW